MKQAILILTVLCGAGAVDTYRGMIQGLERQSTVADYDRFIADLQEMVEALKAARDALAKAELEKARSDEQNTYVSVWALWQAGEVYQHTINPTRDGFTVYVATDGGFNTISPAVFQKWLNQALALDREQHKRHYQGKTWIDVNDILWYDGGERGWKAMR